MQTKLFPGYGEIKVDPQNHPTLLGYSAMKNAVELNSTAEVAEFIYEQGLRSNVQICTADGKPFISTIGFFLDRIASIEYRDALLKELIPRQMGMQEPETENFDLLQQM